MFRFNRQLAKSLCSRVSQAQVVHQPVQRLAFVSLVSNVRTFIAESRGFLDGLDNIRVNPSGSLRSYSNCCPGLDLPPPSLVVVIEYDSEDVDAFIALADAIEGAFPTVFVQGNEEEDGRPGSFEIKVDTEVNPDKSMIHSRLGGAGMPNTEAVLAAISDNLKKLTEDAASRAPRCTKL